MRPNTFERANSLLICCGSVRRLARSIYLNDIYPVARATGYPPFTKAWKGAFSVAPGLLFSEDDLGRVIANVETGFARWMYHVQAVIAPIAKRHEVSQR